MDYDYEKYCEILTNFLSDSMLEDQDDLVIGENISTAPEIKIIFDGFGDLETEDENGEYVYEEGGNREIESYAIFIHKDSLTENFEFPEHEFSPWALIHRPNEEVCIYAWYSNENYEWDVQQLDDAIDNSNKMTGEEVMVILESLNKKYYE